MIPGPEPDASWVENRIEMISNHEFQSLGNPALAKLKDASDPEVLGFVIPFPTQPGSNCSSLSLTDTPRGTGVSPKKQLTFQSKSMNELVRLATQFAASTASVMVTGESGTGKELFSRLIHEKSARAEGPFLALNCAAVPEPLMESEVFGHERGAFTGAIQKRLGYFERANGGTLLLDEITEIPVTLQAKFLRVIEEQEVQPVGGDRPRKIDVRIVATTNRDLKQEVAHGRFRSDLYHRLNVLDLRIPPLRDRVSDIPLLTMHFVEMFRAESRIGINRVTKTGMQSLCGYHWPGNVRELRNVIHRACILATTGEINLDSLPDFASPPEGACDVENVHSLAGLSLADVERRLIVACLRKFDGNKKAAAEELGVTARTLSNKLRLYREQGLPSQ
jgi:DNA-binding NtrC family response regulator